MAGQLLLKSQSAHLKPTTRTSSPSHTPSTSNPPTQPRNRKSRATNPNRFNKFHQFRKIPPEIRLKIWRYTMRPRVIRAEYQNVITSPLHSDVRISRMSLDAGPVPAVLGINVESRMEALRFYSLLKAKLPVHSLERAGERLPPGAKPRAMPKWLDMAIWVNPDIDTVFFVNFPSTHEFLSYFRRLSRPSVGGLPLERPIKHLALMGTDTQRFRTSGRTDLFYSICMEHKSIRTLNIVLDNSNFREALKPEGYSLWKVDPLPTHSGRGGGLHGGRELRDHCVDIFRGFWEGKKTVKDWEKWVEWKKNNKEWSPPKVMFKRIAKIGKNPVKKPKKVVVEISDDDESGSEGEGEDGEGAKQKRA
ncbi:hypothetical protein VTL71DRAFT_14493 [Oculimacula yallundae]|uniref:2EXR domain-containing protein n=1 Tax=Oculimacula yallundae TaxID=86028 RepID=A0ABR4CKY2_9HELO